MDCLFCKIIEGKIPAGKVAETPEAIVIRDIQPQAPQHLLVIPRKHVASLNEMSVEERQEILPSLYDLADQCAGDAGFRASGYRTVINNQKSAGQTVFHLHMHVLGGGDLRGGFGA